MLTTLDVEKLGIDVGPKGAQAADAAGYESVRPSLPVYSDTSRKGVRSVMRQIRHMLWQGLLQDIS